MQIPFLISEKMKNTTEEIHSIFSQREVDEYNWSGYGLFGRP
jgi:hypothetical protein